MNILSKHQYAGKKGTGAEDCMIAVTKIIQTQHNHHNPVELATSDSSDADDAQHVVE